MRAAVVGSGPAGVAAARALLDGGVEVDLLDFGNEIEPEADALAARLRDGAAGPEERARLRPPQTRSGLGPYLAHLLGVLRGREPLLDLTEKAQLGSHFTQADVEWGIPVRVEGAPAPVSRSLARGGLSNVWGAACYPLSAADYAGWPLSEAELAPHYRAVARLLSLIEVRDDLAADYPLYGEPGAGLALNPPAALLLEHWQRHAGALGGAGIRAGRARLAVRAADAAGGAGCRLCGLCLSGCPWDAIYSAGWTLAELAGRPGYRYRPGLFVERFEEGEDGVRVLARRGRAGAAEPNRYDALFLAAGTVSSLRIAAESCGWLGREVPLLDNDLYLQPLLAAPALRAPPRPLHFALNELALRLDCDGAPLHVQLYCLSSAVTDRLEPLLAVLPGALRRRAEALRARVLLAFLYLPGARSARIRARVESAGPVARVVLAQARSGASRPLARGALRALAAARPALGLRALGPALRSTPAGHSGGHLVGALRMARHPGPLESHVDGRLAGSRRVYVVDGAALPELPPQNSTFTIMANAHRVATRFAARAR